MRGCQVSRRGGGGDAAIRVLIQQKNTIFVWERDPSCTSPVPHLACSTLYFPFPTPQAPLQGVGADRHRQLAHQRWQVLCGQSVWLLRAAQAHKAGAGAQSPQHPEVQGEREEGGSPQSSRWGSPPQHPEVQGESAACPSFLYSEGQGRPPRPCILNHSNFSFSYLYRISLPELSHTPPPIAVIRPLFGTALPILTPPPPYPYTLL